jgi:hypothetical protein
MNGRYEQGVCASSLSEERETFGNPNAPCVSVTAGAVWRGMPKAVTTAARASVNICAFAGAN